jgi:hypothetical protein
MGNCQAAEAATVVIQHPGNKIERIYSSVSAHEIMNSNPGHYVALVVTSPTTRTENGLPLKQLKLLRPDDTLLIGHVYRLVSFEGNYLHYTYIIGNNLFNLIPFASRCVERVCCKKMCEIGKVVERE